MDPPPAFDDLEAWIEAAQRVADVRETSKVFEENIRAMEKPAPHGPKTLTTVLRTLPPAPPVRTFNYQARLPIPVANSRPEPTKVPDGPVPMDVDRTCGKASISNIVCRCCGKTGHIARFCDTNFDVRSLTVEEKEELLYGLMADLDMSENPGAEPSGEEEVVSEREDFAKRDERPTWERRLPTNYVLAATPSSKSLSLKVSVQTTDTGEVFSTPALVDCGATGQFMDADFVCRNRLTARKLAHAIPVLNVDGTRNEGGVRGPPHFPLIVFSFSHIISPSSHSLAFILWNPSSWIKNDSLP
ncbi:hypothetical protein M422DRAFT_245186 [Sphaerobolus stellatus SS14]|nr:hypothetical protein M422DRAFT_245186 [Sphaerobolus stellatus SS14]